MGSNLKQEAMERVGEVKHHECYYDTDRNKPLPGWADATSVYRNSVLPYPVPMQVDGEPDESFYRRIVYVNGWNECLAAINRAPHDAAQAAPEALDHSDILTSMLWLYRRLPRTYGRMAYIERSIKEVAKFTPIVVDDLMAERDEPVAQPTDTTKGA